MKIYTKTGDKGETSLLGGRRVSKAHIKIDAYGTVDELNAHLGLVADMLTDDTIITKIRTIQDRLFVIGSQLASDPGHTIPGLPQLSSDDITYLEDMIDTYELTLTPLQQFIIPGGDELISHIHITRTVCRRAERGVVLLSESEAVDELLIQYLNRLSDVLFVLARVVAHQKNIQELPWKGIK